MATRNTAGGQRFDGYYPGGGSTGVGAGIEKRDSK